MKAQKFVNGLLPDLYVNVKPHNDQTWNGAVDRAKSYELTYQDQAAVSAYMNKYAPAVPNTQINVLNDVITNLTQQIGQIAQAFANQMNQNRRTGFRNNAPLNNQPGQIQQPNRVVCFSCGQPGHVRRNCLNLAQNLTAPVAQNPVVPPNPPKDGNQPNVNSQAQVLQQLLAQL